MEVVRKAADAVRNSPLFRRRFGHQGERREDRSLHPDRDLTPFVQGIYYKVSEPSGGRVAILEDKGEPCFLIPDRTLLTNCSTLDI